MKTGLDHLPEDKRDELEHVVAVLAAGFEAAIAGGTQPWRRNGQILKVILFGSFSRTDWVDEPENGYRSDWDLLIIVSHEKLTDIAEFWYAAEDKLLHDPAVKRTVNIIVHTLAEVNQALTRGEYFWTEIIRDGVMLRELPGHPLAQPKPATPAEAYAMAKGYYEEGCKRRAARWRDGRIPAGARAVKIRNGAKSAAFIAAPGGGDGLRLLPARADQLFPSLAQHQVPALAGRGQGPPADRGLAARSADRPAPLRATQAGLRREPATRMPTRSAPTIWRRWRHPPRSYAGS